MKPIKVGNEYLAVLETEEDRSIAAIRAPGLANKELPYIMRTVIGSRLLIADLQRMADNPDSPHRGRATHVLGDYLVKLDQMEAEESQKGKEQESPA